MCLSLQVEDRKARLEELRALGIDPYGHRFEHVQTIAAVREKGEALKLEVGQTSEQTRVRVAGRAVKKDVCPPAAWDHPGGRAAPRGVHRGMQRSSRSGILRAAPGSRGAARVCPAGRAERALAGSRGSGAGSASVMPAVWHQPGLEVPHAQRASGLMRRLTVSSRTETIRRLALL